MARVSVTTEDGRLLHAERVVAADFATGHFRRQLAERLWWAVEDAEALEAQAPADDGDRRRARPLAAA